jgi:hypothetical protein
MPSAIFGSDPDTRCRYCGTLQQGHTGETMPDVCVICAGERSLIRYFAEIKGMTSEQSAERLAQYVAARGASHTRNERKWEK